jgi:hypothetical protein
MIRIAAGLAGHAQLSPEPLAVGKVHGEQSLEGRQQTARRRCPTPMMFELCDDLTLTRDAFLGLDDVPFGLGQVLLPDGAVHRTQWPSSSRKTKAPARPFPAGTLLAFLGRGVGEGMPAGPS